VKTEASGHRVDLALSWNAESTTKGFLPQQKFKTFDFLRYERSMENLKWSAMALLTGNSVSDTTDMVRYRGTWGTNLQYSTPAFQGRASFYYQHHLNPHGGNVSAFCGSVQAGTPILPGKLRWSAGLDYITGQDETRTDPEYQETSHAFDLLYGRRHAFYGYMDYFSNMPSQGLQDYMLKAEFTPGTKVVLQADYHLFWLAAKIADPELPGRTLDRRLGDELDLTLIWKISTDAVLQAGYSLFLTQSTLEAVKGVSGAELRFPQFAYVMITITPGFTFER
jgi:hypothetical protein